MLSLEGAPHEIAALVTVIALSGAVRRRGSARRLESALASLPEHVERHLEAVLRLVRAEPARLLRDTHCPECHVRFAALLESRLRERSVFFFCPHCKRPLYRIAGAPAEAGSPARRRSG